MDSTLCETKPLAVEVGSAGYTRVVEGKAAKAAVALEAHVERLFDSILTGSRRKNRRWARQAR